jgi:Mg-chelatase subunit ChlD
LTLYNLKAAHFLLQSNNMTTASQQLAAVLLGSLGFQAVGNNDVMARLNAITPSGGTAMRDSLLTGVTLILKVNEALMQIGEAENWHFVHIIITDGQDTESKASLEDTAAMMYLIGQTIPISRCRTIIIGIDLGMDPQATIELITLQQLGGENCEIYEIGSVEISDLFQRIQVSLGIVQQRGVGVVQTASGQRAVVVAQRNQPVMQVSRTSFAVIFNVDISGSMSGSRYQRVKQSVGQFLASTPPDDLVAGICFNSAVNLLGVTQPQPVVQRAAQPRPATSSVVQTAVQPTVHAPVPVVKGSGCCLLS